MPLTGLPGVGEKTQQKFHKLGLQTRGDLLLHCPYRYEDRSRLTPIQDTFPGQFALIEGDIIDCKQIFKPKRRMVVRVADKSGVISLAFFHFAAGQFKRWVEGTTLRCYGQITQSRQGKGMVHPEVTLLSPDESPPLPSHYIPVYSTVAGLPMSLVRKSILATLGEFHRESQKVPDSFSQALSKITPMTMSDALEIIHRPQMDCDCEALLSGDHPAMERLVREELFAHQLSLAQLRAQSRNEQAVGYSVTAAQEKRFTEQLPFTLTDAQQRVWSEIKADLKRSQPMMRLVQGDVGCGKTVIAAMSAFAVVSAGSQVAVMVPTEILAEQHFKSFTALFEPLGFRVDLFTGKLKAKARRSLNENLQLGLTHIVIGTHALFQDPVQFKQLGLVVIDEQHRFGVHQRLSLQKKGEQALEMATAHQLIMTATPIPRTLAMSRYAHLDLSTIDSLPPNRQPITTIVLPQSRREDVIARIKERVASGQQVYWVCTLIEESETLNCKAAEDTLADLQALLASISVALVHGKMSSAEKETVMQAFYAGEIQILVATTVIEVGVDVPNATLIVIENPERLGLAQLHQLRGRVGRGKEASFCVLLYQQPLTEVAQSRLAVIRESQDGFKIAEADLALRGAGEILGKKQTGAVSFKFADYSRDADLIATLKEWTKPLSNLPQAAKAELMHRWCRSTEYAEA